MSQARSMFFESALDKSNVGMKGVQIVWDPRAAGGPQSTQEAVTHWRNAIRELFDTEVAKAAKRIIDERIAGPYSHEYKGVAVTEEQFWLLMKAEGFERPEAEQR